MGKYNISKYNMLDNVKQIWNQKDNRQLLQNVAGNYAVKGLTMLVSFFTLPAYMHYFQSQTLLGMWFTVTSVLSWIMMFDFGIGGGVRNQFVEPYMNGDKKKMKEILSAAYLAVGFIVLILIFLQSLVVDKCNWYQIFAVKETDINADTLNSVIHILLIGICLRFFASLTAAVLYAMQQATIPNLMVLAPNIMILFYMHFAHPTGSESDIIHLAVFQAVAINIPTIIVMIALFCGKLKGTFPSIKIFRIHNAKRILRVGGILFYLQIIITLLFGVKELFISWFVGAVQVVDYQIYYKLIGLVSSLFSLALNPVWSAVTKASIAKNYNWIKKLYITGAIIIGIFSIGQLFIVAIMPWISKIWLGQNAIDISYKFGFLFCIYNTFYMWVMMNYNFACGMGRLRKMSIYLTIAVLLNLVLAYCWCAINPSWMTVVLATVVAIIPCAIFLPFDVLKIDKE